MKKESRNQDRGGSKRTEEAPEESEGEIIVVKTDKSCRFVLMSLEEYQSAGEVHTSKDSEVNLDFLINNQRNSTHADGGPFSRVCARETLHSAPH